MQIKQLPPTPPKRTPMRIQRAVLVALVIRDLRARVEGRWIGLLWMLMEPLVHVLLILTLIGVRQRATSSVDFPVFLITGMLPFFIFRNLMRRLPNAVTASRSLFAYRQIKPIDAMLARGIVETGLYSGVYVVALMLLGWLGHQWFPEAPLELMAVSFIVVALGTVFGILFAVLVHNRPKVETFIGWISYPLYFASGVIFPLHNLSESVRQWLLFNPVLHLVELSRAYFITNYQRLPGVNLVYPLAWTLVVAALALSLYRINRHDLVTAE
jgi:capsular polysaccharide transport system permease protein